MIRQRFKISNPALEKLDLGIRKFLRSFPEIESRAKELTTQLSDVPTFQKFQEDKIDLTRFSGLYGDWRYLIALGIIQWYLPDEVRCLLNVQLTEIEWPERYFEAKEILLTSKDFALAYVFVNEHFNFHDFFGNILDKSFAKKFVRLHWAPGKESLKVVFPAHRKRGHRESHRDSLSSSFQIIRKEEQKDLFLREKEILRLVEKESYRNKIINLVIEFLCPALAE